MASRTSGVGWGGALALAAVMLLVSTVDLLGRPTPAAAAGPDSGPAFTISSTISSSAISADPPAQLSLGAQRYLWYRVGNPLSVPITITALDIESVDAPATCSVTNLDLGDPEFTGAHVVPPRSTNVVPAPAPISLINKPNVNQDGCKNATFRFTFSGTAQYTDTTSTVLTSSASPTAQGTPVTFTATVAAGNADRHGGRPTGTVTFYTCASDGCDPTTVLGTATIGAGSQATWTTSALPGGTTRVRAVHAGSGTDFAGSSSNVVSQVVTPTIETQVVLATSLKSSTLGQPVLLTATVTSRGRSAAPSGSVAFFLIPTSGAHTLLGTRLLDQGGQASLTVSSMPAGSGGLYAVYQGSTPFARSTSEVIRHAIIAPPPECAGTYTTWIIATPDTPVVRGTPGTDFIYAVGGNYRIKGRQGNDCLVAGDGTNRIADGKGADVVIAGDGRNKVYVRGGRNTVIVGDGARNRVKIRKGNGNLITVGDGYKARVKIRKGNGNQITVGNGDRARVRVRKGKDNRVTMGSGNRNRAFVRKGNRNWISIGDGDKSRVKVRRGNKSRVEVGAGDRNRVFIRKGRKSQITVGDGYKNKVIVRRGSKSRITVGDGDRNRVYVRRGNKGRVVVGDGSRNRLTMGKGKRNRITVGVGTRNRIKLKSGSDRVRIATPGSRNVVSAGAGRKRIHLGGGTENSYRGGRGKATCYLPAPPSPWVGKAKRYYRDSISRCRVVTT